MNRSVLIAGSSIGFVLVAILFLGLGKDPQAIDSPLVGRAAPPFALREAGTTDLSPPSRFTPISRK